MKRISGILLLTMCLAALTACSSFSGKKAMFRDRTQAYLTSQSLPPLKLPTDVKSQDMASYYPIPNEKKALSHSKPVTILPPDLAMAPQQLTVKKTKA